MIQVIETEHEFRELRAEWNELLEQSRSNCFFLTWEWLYTWWKHLAGGRKLFLVTARDGEKLVAIAPLARRRSRLPVGWPFDTLEFLGVGTVGSDYLDFIVRRDKEEQLLPVLSERLAREHCSISLAQVNSASCLAQDLARHWTDGGGSVRALRSNICPKINLSHHTWESYFASLGSEHRYNFRRKLRKLTSRFDVRFEPARTDQERQQALTTLLNLHAARWEERGTSDAFETPQILSFHEELSSLALQRGWLRLFTLWLDGKAVASLYGFQYDGVFYFYQSGLDPALAPYSVGLITMGLAIQEAIGEGCKEYDLLHGDEPYKFHWAHETRELSRLEFYPAGWLGTAWKQARKANSEVKQVARRVLPTSLIELLAEAKRKRAIKSSYGAYST